MGYSLLLKKEKIIAVDERRVTICNGKTFGCVAMEVRGGAGVHVGEGGAGVHSWSTSPGYTNCNGGMGSEEWEPADGE